MNISIYIKLLIAYYFDKVKISPNYRHMQYVIDKEYFEQIPNGDYYEVNGFPFPGYSDYYSITTKGKSDLFDKSTLWHTRMISYIALLISFIALFMWLI